MKVQAMFLGEYGTSSSFYLYRIPMAASPPLASPSASVSPTIKQNDSAMYYYCLEDLERLGLASPGSASFNHVNTAQLYREYPTAFCKNAADGYTYVNTQVCYDLAVLFKSTVLMDLCHLSIHTPKEKRLAWLDRITLLRTANNNGILNNGQLVQQVLHPVRLDGQEWFLQPWMEQPPLMIRLSPPEDDLTATSMKQQSSLLLQRRLAPKLGRYAPALTINTPAYKDHHRHSIQSAPLRKSISKHQINKRLQAFPESSRPRDPRTNNKQKQQFLGPFEYLFDTLEHVRGQKVVLDDTIRQSSAWLGKIQQSLPGMIERQVTDQMNDWMTHYTDEMQHCMDRLLTLENKVNAKPVDELQALMQRIEWLEQKVR